MPKKSKALKRPIFKGPLGEVLKSISRTKIGQFGIEAHIINEKTVLEELNYAHIIRLVKTFKDEKAVHLLMTFINGIEMFDMIRQIDLLDNLQRLGIYLIGQACFFL